MTDQKGNSRSTIDERREFKTAASMFLFDIDEETERKISAIRTQLNSESLKNRVVFKVRQLSADEVEALKDGLDVKQLASTSHVKSVLKPEEPAKPQCRSVTRLRRPPGGCILPFVAFIYSRKKFDRVFAETIADMRDEYCAALSTNDIWKARWAHLRGLWSILAAMVADVPVSITRLVVKLWKAAQ
jgi:hypothetical protein